jgi:hypothetical protein
MTPKGQKKRAREGNITVLRPRTRQDEEGAVQCYSTSVQSYYGIFDPWLDLHRPPRLLAS